MRARQLYRRAASPVAALLLFALAGVAPAPATTPDSTVTPRVAAVPTAPKAAATVNGIEIEREAVQQLVMGLARAEPSPPDSDRISELTNAALESLIDLELLYQEAVRRKIQLPDSDIDREVAEVRRHFDSEKKFTEALASRGMTPSDLRLDTRRTLMAERLLQATVWRDLRITTDEVVAFYDQNRKQLGRPLDEIDDSIARMLLDDKRAEKRAELVGELRKGATIVRFPPYGGAARAVTPAGAAPTGQPTARD